MGRNIILCVAISLVLCGLAIARDVDKLIILTEEYPPDNYMENGKVVGDSTEIVVEILKRIGSKLTRQDIRLVPWARAYGEALNDKSTIVYSIGRTTEREHLFKWGVSHRRNPSKPFRSQG